MIVAEPSRFYARGGISKLTGVTAKGCLPHVTGPIQDWIERVAKIPVGETNEEPDVCIVELGGTVGGIESAPFAEVMRQFQFGVGYANFALIHVSFMRYKKFSGIRSTSQKYGCKRKCSTPWRHRLYQAK